MYDDAWYRQENKRFNQQFGEELRRLDQWEFSELEFDFLGFFSEYACVHVPDDFVVIDMGSYMGIQADYFKNCAGYIGVDVFVPVEWRFRQANATHYQQSIQDFIKDTLPTLGLDLNKVIAICSYVPDQEAQYLVAETFPYHRVVYCDDIISERLPGDEWALEDER
ncbi:MAG: hypothetical protein IJ342_07710 [Muribaculaceae bacterium]|nr:hypothetical protein [Muribaculaceae bacterium]